MALTPQQEEQQLQTDRQALATSDVAALQAFRTAQIPSAQAIVNAAQTLVTQLGDIDRQAWATSFAQNITSLFGELDQRISEATAVAGNVAAGPSAPPSSITVT